MVRLDWWILHLWERFARERMEAGSFVHLLRSSRTKMETRPSGLLQFVLEWVVESSQEVQ